MNEMVLTRLKTVIERAVRPVRASTTYKRKMREELLAHVSSVFDEESAKLRDESAALEQTARRFGNPADVTRQLQESVPASDALRRFWEGQPGEPVRRAGFRIAWVTGALAVVVFAAALFARGWVDVWPREALLLSVVAVLSLPVYLFGLTFLTEWMAKALDGPQGTSRIQFALAGFGSFLFMMAWAALLNWPGDWDYPSVILLTVCLGPIAVFFPFSLAKSANERRHYHEEWASLPIDANQGVSA